MLLWDFVQLTYGLYTLLILQKYLGDILRLLKSVDAKLFTKAAIEKEAEEELQRKDSNNGYLSKVKQWVLASTGVAAVYFTGTAQYVLPLVNVVVTVFSNLPAFTRVGAPILCLTMKMYGFKYDFLRGWFVLTLQLMFLTSLLRFSTLPPAASIGIATVSSLSTFCAYHITYEDVYAFLQMVENYVRKIRYKELVAHIVEEIVTNG